MIPRTGAQPGEQTPPAASRTALPALLAAAILTGGALLLPAGPAAGGPSDVGLATSELGPEPGHTGGFGEPTCRSCHFDGPEQADGVVLSIEGMPPAWSPGQSYELEVVLRGEPLRRGGFQLAVRYSDGDRAGRQAGSLAGSDQRLALTESGGVAYLHHTVEGTRPTSPGEIRWPFTWAAPDDAAPVAFHVAANAANDDNSEFGDLIVSTAAILPAEPLHMGSGAPARRTQLGRGHLWNLGSFPPRRNWLGSCRRCRRDNRPAHHSNGVDRCDRSC